MLLPMPLVTSYRRVNGGSTGGRCTACPWIFSNQQTVHNIERHLSNIEDCGCYQYRLTSRLSYYSFKYPSTEEDKDIIYVFVSALVL